MGRSDEELSTYLSVFNVNNMSFLQTQFLVSMYSVQYSIWLIYSTATYTHFFVIQLMTNTSKLKRSFDQAESVFVIEFRFPLKLISKY